MQALFLISLFTFVIALMTSFIVSGTFNAAQLTKQRLDDTFRYFESMAEVIRAEVTQENMHGNPGTYATIPQYISNMPTVAAMSSGIYGNAATDAWGREITGAMLTRYMRFSAPSDSNQVLSVPVTAFAFVSGGPDGQVQTTLPSAPTQLSDILNIAAPTDAQGNPTTDDIVYTFDNRREMMLIIEDIKGHASKVGVTALKKFQADMATFRDQQLADYRAAIVAGQTVSPPSMDFSNNPNAPRLPAVDVSSTQALLGIFEDVEAIERILPSGGRLVLSSNTPNMANPNLVITVRNHTTNPTPLGPGASFLYTLIIQPDKDIN